MQVAVGEVVADHGTIWTFEGIEVESGDLVHFGTDHRIARNLRSIILNEGEVICEVEDWQILNRARVVA